MTTEDLTAEIAAALGNGPEVRNVVPLSSGASRQSWKFEAGDPPATFVLQREMMRRGSGQPITQAPLGMAGQAKVLQAAAALGVPVPNVVAAGATEDREYMITDWLDGEALAPKLLRDPELRAGCDRLLQDCASALAAIHRIEPDPSIGLAEIDRLSTYRQWLSAIEPRPVLELAYRWLERNRPEYGEPVVVHGDFRLGNLLVGREGLQAVLDWEVVHLGDRHEDLAWATIRAWRFDRYRRPGVFPEPEPWVDAYAAAAGAGVKVDRDVFRWWQVAGTWMWAVISAMQARRHLDGWVQSMEHAAIGRRVCESEWDVLNLLSPPTSAPSPPAGDESSPDDPVQYTLRDLHGRPTAMELLDAVAGYLRDQLGPQLEGAARHQVRIATRALETVGRELDLGAAQARAHAERLKKFHVSTDADLVDDIRKGSYDDDGELLECLRDDTRDRLLVANPKWLTEGV